MTNELTASKIAAIATRHVTNVGRARADVHANGGHVTAAAFAEYGASRCAADDEIAMRREVLDESAALEDVATFIEHMGASVERIVSRAIITERVHGGAPVAVVTALRVAA